jgi:hypothetical protein
MTMNLMALLPNCHITASARRQGRRREEVQNIAAPLIRTRPARPTEAPLERSISRPLVRAFFVALGALVLLNMADLLTTHIDLSMAASHGRHLVEGNPLAKAMSATGRVAVAKGLLLGLLAWRAFRRGVSLSVLCATWAVAGIYAMTVVSNLLALTAL